MRTDLLDEVDDVLVARNVFQQDVARTLLRLVVMVSVVVKGHVDVSVSVRVRRVGAACPRATATHRRAARTLRETHPRRGRQIRVDLHDAAGASRRADDLRVVLMVSHSSGEVVALRERPVVRGDDERKEGVEVTRETDCVAAVVAADPAKLREGLVQVCVRRQKRQHHETARSHRQRVVLPRHGCQRLEEGNLSLVLKGTEAARLYLQEESALRLDGDVGERP